MSTGVELIAAERQRQIEAEGWTPEHDDGYHLSELRDAAVAYALVAGPIPAFPAVDFWPEDWDLS